MNGLHLDKINFADAKKTFERVTLLSVAALGLGLSGQAAIASEINPANDSYPQPTQVRNLSNIQTKGLAGEIKRKKSSPSLTQEIKDQRGGEVNENINVQTRANKVAIDRFFTQVDAVQIDNFEFDGKRFTIAVNGKLEEVQVIELTYDDLNAVFGVQDHYVKDMLIETSNKLKNHALDLSVSNSAKILVPPDMFLNETRSANGDLPVSDVIGNDGIKITN